MGGRSGGGGGLLRGDSSNNGKVKGVESLKNIKDRKLYNAVKQTISRYYSTMGLEQKNVKLADLEKNIGGLHKTVDGKSEGVYLNKKIFKTGTVESVTKTTNTAYSTKLLTKTNKPVAHILTHELAHSTWNEHLSGAKYQAAGKAIQKVYNSWKADKNKSGYGSYSKTNVSEFWAETVTKGIHGKSDKYTKALKGIAQKYKL